MRKLIYIAISLGLLACAVAAPVETGRFELTKNPRDTALVINSLARECWSKAINIFTGGIVVENRVTLSGIVITARFSAPDLGYHEPFFRATVSEDSGKTSVVTEEIEYHYDTGMTNSADVATGLQAIGRARSNVRKVMGSL